MARTKQVFSKDELCHVWANQLQDSGRDTGSMFFENKNIYSYGRHFPIAVHYNDVVLFTERTYSNTTAKHIAAVRSAASHLDKVYCYYPDLAAAGNHQKNIDSWIFEINETAKNLAKARKPEKYFALIAGIKDKMQKYLDFFKIELSKAELKSISFETPDEYIQAVKDAAAQKEKDHKIKMTAGAKVYAKEIAVWKDGKTNAQWHDIKKEFTDKERSDLNYYHDKNRDSSDTFLRVKDENIETSKGIKMPIDVAKRYFSFYNRILAKGGCEGNCGYKMLDYEVRLANEKSLIVGCHNISAVEIKELAAKMNW